MEPTSYRTFYKQGTKVKIKKEEIKRIIIEELREMQEADEEKDAILAIVYAID